MLLEIWDFQDPPPATLTGRGHSSIQLMAACFVLRIRRVSLSVGLDQKIKGTYSHERIYGGCRTRS